MITGEFVGKLNIQKFAETLAKLVGEQYNVKITVKSIRRKETMEEIQTNKPQQLTQEIEKWLMQRKQKSKKI